MSYALKNWKLIRIHGRDPVQLLQGQTTVDVKNLQEGRGVNGALCTPKGRMVANFGMASFEGDIWLSLPADRVEAVQTALARFLPFFGCELSVTAYQGAGSDAPMDAPIVMDLDGLFENWFPQAVEAGPGWEAQRISKGLGWIDAHSDEAFTPQQLHLQSLGGISFTKGCYTGQEVIARTEHLGQVKKSLVPVSLSHACPPQDLFVDERKVGFLLNTAGDQGLAIMGGEVEQCQTSDGVNITRKALPYEILSPIKSRQNR